MTKIKIKAHPDKKLHAKIYIFKPENFNQYSTGSVITGSSNFSKSGLGLTKNPTYEFNVELRDYDDVKFASDEFDKLWDEAIDILFRSFCEPGIDNVIIVPPTYGMYEVSANINDVQLKSVNLTEDYQLNLEGIAEAIDKNTKLIFICSPNNPTGNSINREDIETILANFNGIVVVDEAYINFSRQKTFIQELTEYANLVVLQTLSKAWGLAALRVGMAFASEEIIEVFNRVKPPYNINEASQTLALEALQNTEQVNDWIKQTLKERDHLVLTLKNFDFVLDIYPSDANFILVKTTNANSIYDFLVSQGIIVRNRNKVELCEGCLRITVGTPLENEILINTLKSFEG